MNDFESLISDVYDTLYARSIRLTKNQHDAEDLLQDAVVLALRSFDSFSRGTNFKAWMFTILHNALLTKIVRNTRFNNFSRRYEKHLAEAHEPAPDELLTLSEIPDEIWSKVMELPEEFRRPLIMAEVEGIKLVDIAKELNLPYGTVLSRVHRARIKLRDKFKPKT